MDLSLISLDSHRCITYPTPRIRIQLSNTTTSSHVGFLHSVILSSTGHFLPFTLQMKHQKKIICLRSSTVGPRFRMTSIGTVKNQSCRVILAETNQNQSMN